MIFLIEYDRPAGRVLSLRNFLDSERAKAQAAKLDLELERQREGVENEIVLLEAESEASLRSGYKRYFQDMRQLLQTTVSQIQAEQPG